MSRTNIRNTETNALRSKQTITLSNLGFALGITLTATIILFLVSTVIPLEPKINGFFCDDKSIRYPYIHKATISSSLMFSISAFFLIFVFFCGTLLNIKKICYKQTKSQKKKRCGDHYLRIQVWLFWYLIGIGLTKVFTSFIKISAGELRPHFLAACDPDMSIINCTDEYGWPLYVTNYTCRGQVSAVREARLSFPSDYASLSSFVFVFSALYISSLEIIHKRSPLQFLFTTITGILLTVLMGMTDIVDNKHHFKDVVAGSVLGTLMAFLVVYFCTSYHYWDNSDNEKNINQRTRSSRLLLINDTTDQQEEEEEDNAVERNDDIA